MGKSVRLPLPIIPTPPPPSPSTPLSKTQSDITIVADIFLPRWVAYRRRRLAQLRGSEDVCGFCEAGISIGDLLARSLNGTHRLVRQTVWRRDSKQRKEMYIRLPIHKSCARVRCRNVQSRELKLPRLRASITALKCNGSHPLLTHESLFVQATIISIFIPHPPFPPQNTIFYHSPKSKKRHSCSFSLSPLPSSLTTTKKQDPPSTTMEKPHPPYSKLSCRSTQISSSSAKFWKCSGRCCSA